MVFILSITGMKKDNRQEKLFTLTHLCIKIAAVIMLVVYLTVYLKTKTGVFLSYTGPALFFIIFLLYNRLTVHFHKKGFFTSWQAAEFYARCHKENIFIFQEENFEKAAGIYFSIFGTDKYLGAGTLPDHMADIYNAGKETTEKQ